MKIAGMVKNSFVDYPARVACVVFVPGCNYDCFYCHNRALIHDAPAVKTEEEVFAFLQKRVGLLGLGLDDDLAQGAAPLELEGHALAALE